MNNTTTQEIVDADLHEKIIAIDNNGIDSYYPIEKLAAHIDNIPHVAISIFIFQDEHLLLQKRADTKYHSGGLWANTVCSHPRWQESTQQCADRRLNEELCVTAKLHEFGQIDYAAKVGQLYENEHVHCFVGRLDSTVSVDAFNRAEVSAVEWLTFPEILLRIEQQPDSFTEWFKIYMAKHRGMIELTQH